MIISRHALPRRTFIRGVGVSLALPFLDAMVPALSARAVKPTLRLGFTYVPNGVTTRAWTPRIVDGSLELSPILESLAPARDYLTVVTGLANAEAEKGIGVGLHSKSHTAWLSGTRLKETEGADIQAGRTLDQIVAPVLSADAPLASLELALEPSFMGALCEASLSCVYTNTFCWRTPTMPLPMENNPRVVFERLFGDGSTAEQRAAELRTDRSILDWILRDLHVLQRKVGPGDRAVIGEYLDSIRDVEHRIDQIEKRSLNAAVEVGHQPLGVPDVDEEHAKLMLDLHFLAYRADITRVVSFQMAREQSQRTYPSIGVPEAHHNVSHHRGDPDRIAMNTKINTYHVSLFAGLVERMRTTPDGDGSLLDHAILLYGAGFGDGDLHSPHDLPVALVGKGCGQLKGNRLISCPHDTPMMNLGLRLMDMVGLELDAIGDSTGRITDL